MLKIEKWINTTTINSPYYEEMMYPIHCVYNGIDIIKTSYNSEYVYNAYNDKVKIPGGYKSIEAFNLTKNSIIILFTENGILTQTSLPITEELKKLL